MCTTCGGHGQRGAAHRVDVAPLGARLALVGKGGVGKSTIAATLCLLLAREGARVLAVDADEQRNLGPTLGVEAAALRDVVPVAQDAEYVREKAGRPPGSPGGLVRLNPDTLDVVDRLALLGPEGIRLLVMGGVQLAGGGCLCPEHAVLASVLSDLRLRRDEVIVMDTHAGVEHFGRSLARGFDAAVVVVDPSANAVQVGRETAVLAQELGISEVHLAVNRVRDATDVERALAHLDRLGGYDFSTTTVLPFDPSVGECDPSVGALPRWSPFSLAVAGLGRALVDAVAGARAERQGA